MKRRSWTTSVGVFLLTSMLAVPAFAGAPTDYVKKRTEKVTTVLSKDESKKRTAELEEILQATIDFRELAGRALGEHWDKRSEEEKTEFLDLLQKLLQANYETKLQGRTLGKDYEIVYVEEKTRDDRAIVKTKIVVKEESRPVDYRLVKKDNKWIIYDVVIDDISLEETYRESYTEIIKEEGWDALIDRMKQRVEEIRSGSAG